MRNPLAMQRALLALRAQAAQWLAEYDAALVARGLGFTPEDVAAVEASHRARPVPAEKPGPVRHRRGRDRLGDRRRRPVGELPMRRSPPNPSGQ